MKPDWTSEDIPSLADKVCIVTGASAGLGVEITYQLAKHGAKVVILAVRNVEKGEGVKKELAERLGSGDNMEVMKLDLSSPDSVLAFAKAFRAKYSTVDVLGCNAGVMGLNPQQRTTEDREMQWATNHLGHFLLIHELWDLIKKSKSCHISMQSSEAQRFGKFDWENLNAEKSYEPWSQYGMTKLANVTFANDLARRVKEAGLTSPVVSSCHPGFVTTELQDKANMDFGMKFVTTVFSPLRGTAATGSQPMLYGLTAAETTPGAFYGPSGFMGMGGGYVRESEGQSLSKNKENMEKLWQISEETLKIKFQV